MEHRLRCLLPGLALAAACAGASAQQLAWTSRSVNLRAGPDRFYPVVAVLPPNAQVVVQGCLSGYRWCDVSFGPERGWVYAGNLRMTWDGRVTPVPPVAPLVGIVIAPFVFDAYWELHYRDRPWYPERHRWVGPPPRSHAPPARVGPPPHRLPPGHMAPASGLHRPPGVQAQPRHPGPPPGHGDGHRGGPRH